MKTTVEIADVILQEAREVASRDGVSLKEMVEEGLRRAIAARQPKRPFRLKRVTYKGKGLHPDLEEGNWEQIRKLIYKGRGG